MSLRLAFIASMSAIFGLVAPAGAVTIEQVITKHLAWLAATDNYRVEIRIIGSLQSGKLGIACVDNTTKPPTVRFDGEFQLPSGGEKHALAIAGNNRAAAATIENRAAEWSMPSGPFGRSFSIIERGLTADEVLRRLHEVALKVEVVENPQSDLVGVRLQANPDFLAKMEGLLDQILLGSTFGGSGDTTVWFNADGQLVRMVLNDGKPDAQVTLLTYLDRNMPAEAARAATRAVDVKGKAQMYPSFLEMLLAVKQDEVAKKP